MTLSRTTDGIKVAGRHGTWYVVGVGTYEGQEAFLLESEQWGDMAEHLVVDYMGRELAEGDLLGY